MPVYRSHLMDTYSELHLGLRIKEARQKNDLTLRDVAKRSSISIPRLSRIENDLHILDVHEAVALAAALEIPWDEFMPVDRGIPYEIAREADMRSSTGPYQRIEGTSAQASAGRHNTFVPLAPHFVGRHLEPVRGRIAPVADDDLQFGFHHEQAFAFVLRGCVELLFKTTEGVQRERIDRGDCVYYRSDVPHCLRSVPPDGAETLHVFSSASAPFDAGGVWPGPGLSTAPNGIALHGIGAKVLSLREARGWTPAQVAARAGLTEHRLVQIEQGRRPVRLDVALKLARTFAKPLHDLVEGAPKPSPLYFVQRAEETPNLETRWRRAGSTAAGPTPGQPSYAPLAKGFPEPQVFPYLSRYANADVSADKLREHNGEEFCYVLDGELQLNTYGEGTSMQEILHAGDALYLDSSVPHRINGQSRNPYAATSAEIIKVFWCPLGERYLFET